MKDQIVAVVLGLLATVLAPMCAWLGAKLASLITAKVSNAQLQGVLVRLDDVIMSVVKETMQTTISAARQADGSLAPDAGAKAKAAALESIKAHLGEKGIAEILSVLGLTDLGAYLGSKVEAAVHDLKAAPSDPVLVVQPVAAAPVAIATPGIPAPSAPATPSTPPV